MNLEMITFASQVISPVNTSLTVESIKNVTPSKTCHPVVELAQVRIISKANNKSNVTTIFVVCLNETNCFSLKSHIK